MAAPASLRLFDNTLIASHDYFGPGCPKNHEGEEFLTSIYRSEDNGLTWQEVNHIAGGFWSSLFAHRGAIYLLGTSAQYGSIVIRRSEDGGLHSGRNLQMQKQGSSFGEEAITPLPIITVHLCRLWNTKGAFIGLLKIIQPQFGPKISLACVISCSVDADLLQAENWQLSSELPYPKQATPSEWAAEAPGWLEGNIVPAPGGKL